MGIDQEELVLISKEEVFNINPQLINEWSKRIEFTFNQPITINTFKEFLKEHGPWADDMNGMCIDKTKDGVDAEDFKSCIYNVFLGIGCCGNPTSSDDENLPPPKVVNVKRTNNDVVGDGGQLLTQYTFDREITKKEFFGFIKANGYNLARNNGHNDYAKVRGSGKVWTYIWTMRFDHD